MKYVDIDVVFWLVVDVEGVVGETLHEEQDYSIASS